MFGFGLAVATRSVVLERFRLYLRFFGLLDFYTLRVRATVKASSRFATLLSFIIQCHFFFPSQAAADLWDTGSPGLRDVKILGAPRPKSRRKSSAFPLRPKTLPFIIQCHIRILNPLCYWHFGMQEAANVVSPMILNVLFRRSA